MVFPIRWMPTGRGASFTMGRWTPPKMESPGTPVAPPRQTFTVDAGGELYGIEADSFAATVFDGAPAAVTPEDTLGNQRVMDGIRRQMDSVVGS
jgi:hypothetical protein